MNFFKNRPSIFSSYFWKDLKYDISCLFFPRNRWATDVIPRRFSDKVELIKNFLFAAVVDYVEKEKGLEGWTEEDIAGMPEHQRNCYQEVSEIYPLIKDLPRQQEENLEKYSIDRGISVLDWLNCPIQHEKLKPAMEESRRLEKLEQDLCERIIKIRESLWT